MATTEADPGRPFLPLVRRLEAAGFRAWPAEHVHFDGSWQLRMTRGHPSRRLNSVVPLDPQDASDMSGRIAAASAWFRAHGLRPAVRQSPLCPPDLPAVLGEQGFVCGARTLVMVADLDAVDYGSGMDHLPTHDVERFSEACQAIDDGRDADAATIAAIIGRIVPTAGLFLMQEETPQAVAMCIHDADLAGLQQVVVAKDQRRQGRGREIVSAALRWARLRGARQGWLQVQAENHAATALYAGMGFRTAYEYSYWQTPQ